MTTTSENRSSLLTVGEGLAEDPGELGAPASPAPGPELVNVAGRRRVRRKIGIPRWARRGGGPLVLLAIWWVGTSTGFFSAQTLASPGQVVTAARELIETGALQEHLWVSLQRVAVGLAIGVSTGALLAIVAGLWKLVEDFVDSAVQVLRSIPVLALTPLLIVWFGIGEEPKIAMVAIATTFPVYLNTYSAIRGVDAKLVETATTFGVGRVGLVRQVIFPGALPGFFVGLRFSLAVCWLVLVISEQINATSGIGFLMNDARSQFRTDIIVLGIVIYAILGLLSDALVRVLERRLLAWRRGYTGT